MSSEDLTKLPRVEVEWWDTEDDPHWRSKDDAEGKDCPLCFSVGRLVGVYKDRIVLAPTVHKDECSRTTIPRGCVKAIYQLRRAGLLGKKAYKKMEGK